MTIIYKIFSKPIISFFIFTLSMSVFSQKYETHNYETLFSDDSFEVRLYDSVLKAKTFSTKGSNNNFGKLFRYISGYNQKNEKISMTTPVYMKDEDKGSMMEFVLPSKFDMENVSMPLSENVEVYLDEGGHYASVQYGGYSNNSKRLRYTKALKEKLKEHNIESFGDFFYLSFDSPYKFYGRRNEVMVAVKY